MNAPGSAAHQQERSFGLSVGFVCALLAAFSLWRGRVVPAWTFGVVAALLIVPALTRPSLCGKEAIGGTKDRGETQIDEIDARDAHRDVAVQHHALVEQSIEQIEHRRVFRRENLAGG